MKSIIRMTFFALIFLSATAVFAQPKISRDKIPEETAAEAKEAISNLYSPDASVRQSACVKLRDMGEGAVAAVPFLENMLYEKRVGSFNPVLPGEFAAWALAEMGDSGFNTLISALKDNNATVRANAICGIGHTKRSESLDYLLAALTDQDRNVRYNSVNSLGSLSQVIDDKRIKEGFLVALKDKDIGVQDQALFWIENGACSIDDTVVKALTLALQDFNKEIRERAARILEKTTGKKYKWRRWYD